VLGGPDLFSTIKPRLTYANVMATIAVFLSLGGGAYAALKLPRNSVGPQQIKSNAVSSSKVENGSLLSGDFKSGQLPAGARGPEGFQGPKGDAGAQGVKGDKGDAGAPATTLWAVVGATGTLLGGTATGAAQDSVSREYEVVFGRDVSHCVAIANQGFSQGFPPVGSASNSTVNALPGYNNGGGVANNKVAVQIRVGDAADTESSRAFELVVFC
jgi:hypothetical protein